MTRPLSRLVARLAATAAVLALLLAPHAHASTAAQTKGRVVVLGLDGADARTIKELVAKDPEHYPTFARLMKEGTFAPMRVEAPPESPVSWAALNTGQNPAKTGVPGFIRVDRPEGEDSHPVPTFGHIIVHDSSSYTEPPLPLSAFDHVPLPTWSPMVMGIVFGGATLLLVVFVLGVVLKVGAPIAIVLGLVLGGGAGWAGYYLRGLLADTYPHTSNPNQARNFWDYAADAGVHSVVLNPAQAWDMPTPDGAEVLGGLGLPDAKGKIGEWEIYTTDPAELHRPPKGDGTPTAGTVYRVDEVAGEIDTAIYGPTNFWKQEKLQRRLDEIDAQLNDTDTPTDKAYSLSEERTRVDDELRQVNDVPTNVPMKIVKGEGSAEITIDGQTQTVGEGEWSGFYELTFPLNSILEVHALTRVKLISLDQPFFKLFVNVLDIDPRRPPFWQSISSPFEFSNELAVRCGLYETYGWPTATMPFKDKEITPETMMQDIEFTMKWRERLLDDQIERKDWRCLFAVFSTTDRVQHMMYQFYDKGHPLYDEAAASRTMQFFGQTIELRDAIPAIYRQMDGIIGRVLDKDLRPDDTLFVVADHGFNSFRYQINLNNWLVQNGYAALKPGVTDRDDSFLAWVDWSKTRVYSLGMGFLYVNEKGREEQGIVDPADVPALLDQLKTDLLAARDPVRDVPMVHDVYITSEVHSGDFLNLESDMMVGFAPPYRIAWSATSGGVNLVKGDDGLTTLGPIVYDNTSFWSGGHVSVALDDVEAAFFSNRKVTIPEGGLRSLHIAPTVLSLLGVPVPPEMDLKPVAVQ